ncbi:MAG: hypothetical protein ACRC8K_20640, partial [Waterburya sp.]
MKIRGENRDFVFLISSDLKQYLQSEVDIGGTSHVQKLLTWNVFSLFTVFIFVGWTMFALPFQEFNHDKYKLQHEQKVAQWEADQKKIRNEEFLRVQTLAKQAIGQEDINNKINFL